jgi:integrase
MNPGLVVSTASDLAPLKELCLGGITSPHTRRAYERALDSFFAWYAEAGRPALNRQLLNAWRAELQRRGLAASSINVSLSALRKLVSGAEEHGLLAPGQAAASRVHGIKIQGIRAGNWLTSGQARRLLQAPDAATLRGKRDRAILALLIGCGLRRAELAQLQLEDLQTRESRWVIPDLKGKGNRLRTVPVPEWVKERIDQWTAAGALSGGRLFRAVNKAGRLHGAGLTEEAVWQVVRAYAAPLGFPHLSPHDLRRTCAKLCRAAGGDLEQIQFLLGHASIQTTERYLGSRQDLQTAVNDHLRLEL